MSTELYVDLRIPDAARIAYLQEGELVQHHDQRQFVRPSSILGGASVLVVDDDVARMQALAQLLRAERVTVATATSPAECLIRVAAQRPGAVVLDLSLCNRVRVALAHNLASLAPWLPIILTSDLLEDHPNIADALRLTKGRFLAKPFAMDDLFALLAQVLTSPRRMS